MLMIRVTASDRGHRLRITHTRRRLRIFHAPALHRTFHPVNLSNKCGKLEMFHSINLSNVCFLTHNRIGSNVTEHFVKRGREITHSCNLVPGYLLPFRKRLHGKQIPLESEAQIWAYFRHFVWHERPLKFASSHRVGSVEELQS